MFTVQLKEDYFAKERFGEIVEYSKLENSCNTAFYDEEEGQDYSVAVLTITEPTANDNERKYSNFGVNKTLSKIEEQFIKGIILK